MNSRRRIARDKEDEEDNKQPKALIALQYRAEKAEGKEKNGGAFLNGK